MFSPSIFYAAKKAGTKIVMTIRNYRLICPNGLMYVHGKICRDCVGKTIPYPAIMKKCYRDDMGATTAIVGMLGVHNILNTWSNKVDGYICISAFVKQQLIKSGFDSGKLHVKYNFVTSPVAPEFTSEGYYIFVGRTSDQKGLPLLLKTFEENKKELMIVGDGPLNEMAESFARRNANITFAGELPLEETYRRIAKAKALIAPSQSDEPFGRTIAEAFAHGTPVIGSALGGISELIQDGVNGFLFDPYQATALQETITKFENFENAELMRRGAFDSYQKKFTSNMNYDSVMEIYNKVLTS
ncbi:glycosyltransferase [Flavobacterium sp.]|uniref:glycosyltransferase n=1 Tax=Flavobacterium sp. TaxID=239 RepID=UPI0025C27356|nr:glycosyltransferase [Flavobacterium sp.]